MLLLTGIQDVASCSLGWFYSLPSGKCWIVPMAMTHTFFPGHVLFLEPKISVWVGFLNLYKCLDFLLLFVLKLMHILLVTEVQKIFLPLF